MTLKIKLLLASSILFLIPFISQAATEFVSTVMASGGDYSSLVSWESAIQSDLTATTTRVFSGAGTGSLIQGDTVTCISSGIHNGITAVVVATTTAGQILLKNATSSEEVILSAGDQWQKDVSNYWTVSGTGSQLGDTAIAVAKIDGAWTSASSPGTTFAGWTTSSANYIYAYTTPSARHQGKWDTNKYRLEVSGTGITINENYVRIEGLQLQITIAGDNARRGIAATAIDAGGTDIRLSDNIIKGVITNPWANGDGILISDTDINVSKVWNNIIYDWTNSTTTYGIRVTTAGATAYVSNNTVQNCYYGIARDNGTVVVKNNIVQDCIDGFNGTFNSASTNNLSDITGDYAYSGTADKTGLKVSFIDKGGDNFHLAGNDANAKNKGADLSADANLAFTTDIDGQARGYQGWDIGADEAFASTMVDAPQTGFLTSGLVGNWTFNGADMDWASTTAEALDRSGQGNNGNVVNGAKPVSGISGQALSFDGSNDYLNTASNVNFNSNIITIAFWLNWDNFADDDKQMTELSTNFDSNPGAFLINPNNSTYGTFTFSIPYCTAVCPGYRTEGITRPTADEWHYYVAILDNSTSAGDITVYLDGVEQSTTVHQGTKSGAGNFITDKIYFMSRAGTSNFGKGSLDEVRIYNRALTSSEALDLYRAGAARAKTNVSLVNVMKDSSLVGHWTFNGVDMDWASTTAEALDRSGQGNNGNAVNGAKPAVGISGQALSFDKVDDYINAGSAASLDDIEEQGGGGTTVSAWIYPKSTGENDAYIAAKDTIPTTSNGAWAFGINSGANAYKLYFKKSYNGSVLSDDTTEAVTPNVWQHVLFINSSAGGQDPVSIYLNGRLLNAMTGFAGDKVSDAANSLYIGNDSATAKTFDGYIDEVRIYNRVLSAGEITDLYQAGARKFKLK